MRCSFISYVSNSGASPKVVQELTRHSNFSLTFDTSARTLDQSKQQAVNFLPDFNIAAKFHSDIYSDISWGNCGKVRQGEAEKP